MPVTDKLSFQMRRTIKPYRTGRFRGTIYSDLPSCLAGVLDDPERTEAVPGSRRVLNAKLRTIWEVPLPDGSAYFVHLFRDQRRRVVARISKIHELMRALQIATFDIVALGHESAGKSRSEFFIARKIPDAVSIPAGLGHRYEVVPEAHEVPEKLENSLASFISDFHRKRIIHGDLKSRHILIQNCAYLRTGAARADTHGPGENSDHKFSRSLDPKFYLVDLEKTRRLWFLPEGLVDLLRVRDLIQLSASCSQLITNQQKIRFLRTYLRQLAVNARRRRIFYFVIRLYSDHDFRQGQTLLQNLVAAMR
ncbi:MAG TPA: lipopolysaccharide kinase InaA family protein [Acidobacteriota bacterium]|jgi:hypothetical protein